MKDVSLLIAQGDELPALLPQELTSRIQVTGVGPTLAQEFMNSFLAQGHPKHIIVLGHCGTVCDDIPIGTVLVAESCSFQGDKIKLQPDEKLLARIKPSVKTEFAVYETFPSVVRNRKHVAKGSEAVDMESFFMAKIAQKHKVPIIIAKTVSDIVPKSNLDAILSKLTGRQQFQPENFTVANFYSSIFIQNYLGMLRL